MKLRIIFFLIISLLWVACDDDDDKPSLSDTDETFVENAALSNMSEIEFGELAATQGSDPLVRDFAQQMISEHTTAQNELRDIANDYSDIDWPEELDEQHEERMEQLAGLNGFQFDSMYMASQITDHQMAINIFETELAGGTDQRVRAYANKYLPHIEAHLERADSIQNVILTNHGY